MNIFMQTYKKILILFETIVELQCSFNTNQGRLILFQILNVIFFVILLLVKTKYNARNDR